MDKADSGCQSCICVPSTKILGPNAGKISPSWPGAQVLLPRISRIKRRFAVYVGEKKVPKRTAFSLICPTEVNVLIWHVGMCAIKRSTKEDPTVARSHAHAYVVDSPMPFEFSIIMYYELPSLLSANNV